MKRILPWVFAFMLAIGAGTYPGRPGGSAPSTPAEPPAEESATPLAPDYADDASWVAKPSEITHDADCFFVLPTVNMRETEVGNEDIYDEKKASRFVKTYAMESEIVTDVTDVYAPFYRQATIACYLGEDGKIDESLIGSEAIATYENLAYEDVRAAWLYYVNNCNNGRPVVLFGYSQGANLLMRLLEEFGSSGVLKNKLVAAYIIGGGVDQQTLCRYPWLRMAKGEYDTGVIISFDAVDARAEKPQTRLYSINPLNWRTDSTPASSDLNLGCVTKNSQGEVTSEVPGYCGAYLDPASGRLVVTDLPNADELYYAESVFPQGYYHGYDLNFFYRNLQKNVSTRVLSYLYQHGCDYSGLLWWWRRFWL